MVFLNCAGYIYCKTWADVFAKVFNGSEKPDEQTPTGSVMASPANHRRSSQGRHRGSAQLVADNSCNLNVTNPGNYSFRILVDYREVTIKPFGRGLHLIPHTLALRL